MTYPLHVAWKLYLSGVTQADHALSARQAKRISKAEHLLAPAGYRWGVEEVRDDFLHEFVPLYNEHIAAKEHGVVFDVQSHVAAGWARGRRYEALVLREREDGRLVGAQIFAITDESLSVVHRVFPRALRVHLPISVSYVAERRLVERALALGKRRILHGKDRNVYGQNSAIGLAEFKFSVGYRPYASVMADSGIVPVARVKPVADVLVFLAQARGEAVTDALLLTQTPAERLLAVYPVLFGQRGVRVTVQSY